MKCIVECNYIFKGGGRRYFMCTECDIEYQLSEGSTRPGVDTGHVRGYRPGVLEDKVPRWSGDIDLED
jgi:hypothetical protein